MHVRDDKRRQRQVGHSNVWHEGNFDPGELGNFTVADKAKLDGIESGATGDQTGAEIKALYEGEADTNAFTDAEQTKLAGVESGATADQTAAEILAALLPVDGPTSLLDADFLDGLEGSAFVKIAGTQTITGSKTFDLTTMVGAFDAFDANVQGVEANAIGLVRVQRASNSADSDDVWRGMQGTAVTSIIEVNGDFLSATNSYGATSDRRTKQDIIDLPSLWDDFKSVRFRRYKLNAEVDKRGADAPFHAGVLSDELEQVPRFASAVTPGDEERKSSVNYSALYVAQGKVLQEAMNMIEQLEARVATLENAR